jgi:hypothetical protein
MQTKRLLAIAVPLCINAILSWTILPFAIPPFQGYSFADLLEVLFWQAAGTVGWPFAIFGALLSLPFGRATVAFAPLLFTLTYPAMLFLLVRLVAAKALRRLELPLLHLLLTFSFVAIWYHVLNGYDFMVG